jgi:hypothetical protein
MDRLTLPKADLVIAVGAECFFKVATNNSLSLPVIIIETIEVIAIHQCYHRSIRHQQYCILKCPTTEYHLPTYLGTEYKYGVETGSCVCGTARWLQNYCKLRHVHQAAGRESLNRAKQPAFCSEQQKQEEKKIETWP